MTQYRIETTRAKQGRSLGEWRVWETFPPSDQATADTWVDLLAGIWPNDEFRVVPVGEDCSADNTERAAVLATASDRRSA